MDNVEMVTRTCVVCGKTFTEPKIATGNKRKYCSEECHKQKINEYRREYLRKRYAEDTEYRDRVRQANSRSMKKVRSTKKEAAMNEVVEQLAASSDKEFIRELLDKKFNIKAEVYDKNAHSLRVPKESRS